MVSIRGKNIKIYSFKAYGDKVQMCAVKDQRLFRTFYAPIHEHDRCSHVALHAAKR